MKTTISVIALAALATSFAAYGATETQNEQTKAAQQIKPHSHMEQKTGVPGKPVNPEKGKVDPWKDQSKHFHPRDGK